jgi:hypothetical protein
MSWRNLYLQYNMLQQPPQTITLVQPFRRRLCVLDRIRTQFFHDDPKHTNRATSALLLLTPSFRASLSTIIITIHTLVVILAIRLQTSTITTLCSFLIRTMRMSRVLLRWIIGGSGIPRCIRSTRGSDSLRRIPVLTVCRRYRMGVVPSATMRVLRRMGWMLSPRSVLSVSVGILRLSSRVLITRVLVAVSSWSHGRGRSVWGMISIVQFVPWIVISIVHAMRHGSPKSMLHGRGHVDGSRMMDCRSSDFESRGVIAWTPVNVAGWSVVGLWFGGLDLAIFPLDVDYPCLSWDGVE